MELLYFRKYWNNFLVLKITNKQQQKMCQYFSNRVHETFSLCLHNTAERNSAKNHNKSNALKMQRRKEMTRLRTRET